MSRRRLLIPEATTDEDVVTMSIWARYVWAYLPCYADKKGRLLDSVLSLKCKILPNDSQDMDKLLQEIADKNHILRYESGGKKFIQIRNFLKYQSPHINEKDSIIPPPPMPVMKVHEISCRSDSYICDHDYNIAISSETEDQQPLAFDPSVGEILFQEWPGPTDPKYTESKKKAVLAFQKYINEENYPRFLSSWNEILNQYRQKKITREQLGGFASFCESRWESIKPLVKPILPKVEITSAEVFSRE